MARSLDVYLLRQFVGRLIQDSHGEMGFQYAESWLTDSGSLAPLYDLVCTAYYPELSQKMAMKIGGEYEADKIYPRHLERLAVEAGLSNPVVQRRVPFLAESIKSKLPEVTSEHPVGIGVAELIRTRCDRMIERFGK